MTVLTETLHSIRDVHYILPAYPRQVRLESAFSCPMACRYCHAWGFFKTPQRKKALMEPALAQAVLMDITSWPQPLTEIAPTNFGEWLANPKWYEIGRLIEQHLPNTAMALPTTGVLLYHPGALERLASLQTLRWVNFSINAYFVETWERVHGVPGWLMAKVLPLPEKLREFRNDVTINISMVFEPTLVTEKEKELFTAYWSRRGFQVTVNEAMYAGHPTLRSPAVDIPCRSVFDGLVVTPDGTVLTGCCFDSEGELVVGHVPEEKLLDIWCGDRLREITEKHNAFRRREISLCSRCTFA